jgi:membrane associated rhomboid family serine protease
VAKTFLKILGAVLVISGIVGFFFPLHGMLDLTTTHNLIHLVSGVIALAASGNDLSSALVAKLFGVVYLLIGAVGLITSDLFGLVTLTGADTAIHFVVAVAALYAGFRSDSA